MVEFRDGMPVRFTLKDPVNPMRTGTYEPSGDHAKFEDGTVGDGTDLRVVRLAHKAWVERQPEAPRQRNSR